MRGRGQHAHHRTPTTPDEFAGVLFGSLSGVAGAGHTLAVKLPPTMSAREIRQVRCKAEATQPGGPTRAAFRDARSVCGESRMHGSKGDWGLETTPGYPIFPAHRHILSCLTRYPV